MNATYTVHRTDPELRVLLVGTSWGPGSRYTADTDAAAYTLTGDCDREGIGGRVGYGDSASGGCRCSRRCWVLHHDVSEDEDGTLAAWQDHRSAVDPVWVGRGGRIVKGTGDGLLVEVPSAVEAVRAAVEVQQLMRSRNAELPVLERMLLRIGVHVGEVVVEGDGDIYGDVVNVVARLEGRAHAGGVCVSDDVHRQVIGRVEYDFDDLGRLSVKNIPHPVAAWQVRLDAPVGQPPPGRRAGAASPAGRGAAGGPGEGG